MNGGSLQKTKEISEGKQNKYLNEGKKNRMCD